MIRGIALGGLSLAVAGIAAPAQAQTCTVFLDQAAFEAFNMDHGKVMKGLEDLEPPISDLPDNQMAVLSPTLEGNVPNVDPATGWGLPNGLLNKNLILQTNPISPNAPDPFPGLEMALIGRNFFGANNPPSVAVGPNWWDESLDLIFDPGENHTGIGFDVSAPLPLGTNTCYIAVFDKNNVEIAKEIVSVSDVPTFFGIWCEQTIGRINVAAVDQAELGAGELVDNIQMWMEGQEPTCPWDCGVPHNKMVDIIDFLALLGEWGAVDTPCDFDGGGVGITDFLKLLGAWGLCPPPYNNQCINQLPIDKIDADTTTVLDFDMYGARPSPDQPYACLPNPPEDKDMWYCLTNSTGFTIGVTISTNLDLYLEVYDGCECDPLGPLVICGEGLVGTEQFQMLNGESVLIRVIDWHDLPNDELKGSVFVTSKPVIVPVLFFTDEPLFDSVVGLAGKVTRVAWDFNPHDQPGDIPLLDDPLNIYTHGTNLHDPWTDDGGNNLWPPVVDNMEFSSNVTPGPTNPLTPRGPEGTGLLWSGNWPGLTNNALVAYWLIDSFDIVSGQPIGPNHTALKMEVISVAGMVPATIQVSVFDTNGFLTGTFPLDYQGGKAFLGIVSENAGVPIGRVDIWDQSGGAEGVSYIEGFWQHTPGVDFHLDPVTFQAEVAAQGKVMKVYWDFKPDLVPPGAPGISISDDPPLDINTHPTTAPDVWDDGVANLWPPEVDNVQFSSNINPGGPWTSRGFQGLKYWKAGSPPPNLGNNALVANWEQDAFDLICGPPAGDLHTAVEMQILQLPGYGHLEPIFHITVFDIAEREIGSTIVPGTIGGKTFIGIIRRAPYVEIGRVDIWDASAGYEGISSFGVYAQPDPP
jgi:hypothetical protein